LNKKVFFVFHFVFLFFAASILSYNASNALLNVLGLCFVASKERSRLLVGYELLISSRQLCPLHWVMFKIRNKNKIPAKINKYVYFIVVYISI
jgi:hypothetical protein